MDSVFFDLREKDIGLIDNSSSKPQKPPITYPLLPITTHDCYDLEFCAYKSAPNPEYAKKCAHTFLMFCEGTKNGGVALKAKVLQGQNGLKDENT